MYIDPTVGKPPLAAAPPPQAEPNARTLPLTMQGFADAYNQLMALLHHEPEPLYHQTATALHEAVCKPVGEGVGQGVSLYELGVFRSPNFREAGRLTVDEKKWQTAMETRRADAQLLFADPDDGLLARLNRILGDFLMNPASERARAHCAAFLIQCGGVYEMFYD